MKGTRGIGITSKPYKDVSTLFKDPVGRKVRIVLKDNLGLDLDVGTASVVPREHARVCYRGGVEFRGYIKSFNPSGSNPSIKVQRAVVVGFSGGYDIYVSKDEIDHYEFL